MECECPNLILFVNPKLRTNIYTSHHSCAIAPLIIGPLTEVTGRRYTYIFSHMFFVLTFLLLALKVRSSPILCVSEAHRNLRSEQHCPDSHRAWYLGNVR